MSIMWSLLDQPSELDHDDCLFTVCDGLYFFVALRVTGRLSKASRFNSLEKDVAKFIRCAAQG